MEGSYCIITPWESSHRIGQILVSGIETLAYAHLHRKTSGYMYMTSAPRDMVSYLNPKLLAGKCEPILIVSGYLAANRDRISKPIIAIPDCALVDGDADGYRNVASIE